MVANSSPKFLNSGCDSEMNKEGLYEGLTAEKGEFESERVLLNVIPIVPLVLASTLFTPKSQSYSFVENAGRPPVWKTEVAGTTFLTTSPFAVMSGSKVA